MEENLTWFRSRRKFLHISPIERKIGCPRGTLQKWIIGERSLPEKWKIKLNEYITDLRDLSKYENDIEPINKIEQSIVQGQYKLIKSFFRKFFCVHKYEMRSTSGITRKMKEDDVLTSCVCYAEVECFCIKCNKRFITKILIDNGILL